MAGERTGSDRGTPTGVPLPVAALDDRRLIAAVLARDRKAAAQLVAAHVDAIYSYVRHRLTPRQDLVDDVVQDVFLAALSNLATFEGTSTLRAWLIGIARHKVEDVYRQRVRAPEPLADGDTPGVEPIADDPPIDQVLDRSRLRARARTILERLPERYGLMLLWRYWEQRTTKDIAAAIGTTEKSVERTLARARARFKDLWLKE